MVKLRIDSTDMRFLLDTGATTVLNIKTFSSGRSKQIQITSWSGTAETNEREVFLPELVLWCSEAITCATPSCRPLTSAPSAKLAVTSPADPKLLFDLMETHMHHCSDAFEQGNAAVLADCFDPDIVLYTPESAQFPSEARRAREALVAIRRVLLSVQPSTRCLRKNSSVRWRARLAASGA